MQNPAPCNKCGLQLEQRERHNLPGHTHKGQAVAQSRHKHVLIPADHHSRGKSANPLSACTRLFLIRRVQHCNLQHANQHAS